MIKLAIVVGHTERQPGASGVSPIDSSEYAWNSDLAAMIVDHVAQVDDAEAKVFFVIPAVSWQRTMMPKLGVRMPPWNCISTRRDRLRRDRKRFT